MQFDEELACRYLEDEGVLEVDMRPRFEAVLRFTTWEDGLRTLVLENGEWREDWIDWQLGFVASARRAPGDHPAKRIAATVPDEALRLAQNAGSFEITALRLLRHHPEATDLARSAPNLFWLVAAHVGAGDIPATAHGALLRMRRVDVLAACTHAERSAAAVRFVEKLVPLDHDEGELRLVERAAQDPQVVRLFHHRPRVYPELLRAVAASLAFIERRFFRDEVARVPDGEVSASAIWEIHEIHDDVVQLGAALGHPPLEIERRIAPLSTVNQLRALHDDWADAFNVRMGDAVASLHDNDRTLPDAGVATPPGIAPIRTVGELRREGIEMRHCVASYVDECIRGESFIYSVREPARATVQVRIVGARPVVTQMRGVRNAMVSDGVGKLVEDWIASVWRAK